MVGFSVGPGDDVEAWCTRCRMNLNHRVIAVVGNSIQRVHCLTCGGDHKYHPPKYDKTESREKRAVRIPSAEKAKRTVGRGASNALGEWTTIMKDMAPDAIPRTYRVTESYEALEFIEHPVFGTGRVLAIVGSERMQAIFKDGRKILVCNRKPTPNA